MAFFINDSHVHVMGGSHDVIVGNDYNFETFLAKKPDIIHKSIVFLNPFRKDLYPAFAKISPYPYRSKVFNYVQQSTPYRGLGLSNTELIKYKVDKVKVSDGNRGVRFVSFQGLSCFYEGEDPFHDENEGLINKCKSENERTGTKNLLPYLYLTLSNTTMQRELDYFEREHTGDFFGIKVHPNLCSRKMSEINFNSKYPLIIHCGVGESDDPKDILEFAKRYKGNVMFAHYARFSPEVLTAIKNSKNMYIDTSPTYLAGQIVNEETNKYFESDLTQSVSSTTELFQRLIEAVGEDKVVFGSDAPWGSQEKAQEFCDDLALDPGVKKKIFESNFEKFCQVKDLTQTEVSYDCEDTYAFSKKSSNEDPEM